MMYNVCLSRLNAYKMLTNTFYTQGGRGKGEQEPPSFSGTK